VCSHWKVVTFADMTSPCGKSFSPTQREEYFRLSDWVAVRYPACSGRKKAAYLDSSYSRGDRPEALIPPIKCGDAGDPMLPLRSRPKSGSRKKADSSMLLEICLRALNQHAHAARWEPRGSLRTPPKAAQGEGRSLAGLGISPAGSRHAKQLNLTKLFAIFLHKLDVF
jgi:hypothetical protein